MNLSKKTTKWVGSLVIGTIILMSTIAIVTIPQADEKNPTEMMEFEVKFPDVPDEIKTYINEQGELPQEQQEKEFEGTFL